MTIDLLPIAAGAVVTLAIIALALYVWTWARYVAPRPTHCPDLRLDGSTALA